MEPYFCEHYGNAASRSHAFGWRADEAVTIGREQIASLINAEAREIVFTSGATESDNMVVKGVAASYAAKGNHIITCVTEHKAILDSCKAVEEQGVKVTYLPVEEDGRVNTDRLAGAITDKTILITIMYANNEIGTIHPIAEIGRIAKERGILFHCDAVQAVGKVPVDVQALGIDMLSISAHKIYGPKGIGALYVRRKKPRVKLAAVIHGGGHERGMRSGTLNVPGIVGLGKALEVAREEMATEGPRLAALRDKLQNDISSHLDEVRVNGSVEHRLPNTLNMSFAYIEGESLMMGLEDVAVSSGSACTSATLEPSYVLRALGLPPELAHSSIRFSLGRFNSEEEVDYVGEKIVRVVNRLREMSPLYDMAKQGIDISTIDWGDHGHHHH
jgi:cysteine desulfurase